MLRPAMRVLNVMRLGLTLWYLMPRKRSMAFCHWSVFIRPCPRRKRVAASKTPYTVKKQTKQKGRQVCKGRKKNQRVSDAPTLDAVLSVAATVSR